MLSELKIYLDRLRGGKVEVIDRDTSSALIDVNEPDLKFGNTIAIQGKSYIADEYLVIALKIKVEAMIPCTICNEIVSQYITIPRFYHTEALSTIKGKVYDYLEPLREAILLEIPPFAECEGGCLKRKELKKYAPKKTSLDAIQFPFAGLK